MPLALGLCHTKLDEPADKVIHLATDKLAAPFGTFSLFTDFAVFDHVPDFLARFNVNGRNQWHARSPFHRERACHDPRLQLRPAGRSDQTAR